MLRIIAGMQVVRSLTRGAIQLMPLFVGSTVAFLCVVSHYNIYVAMSLELSGHLFNSMYFCIKLFFSST